MKTILIITASTIVVLMIVISIAFDLHRTSEETTVSQFQEHQLLHAQQAADLIESYLRTRTTGMQALSSFGSLRQRDLKKMRADLQEYLGYLNEKQVKAMSVFDENGTITYSTSDTAIGRNYAQCDFSIWAKKPENKGKFFISPILRAPLPGEEAASFRALLVTPLYQINNLPRNRRPSTVKVPTGKFIGALSMTVDLGELLAKQLASVNSKTKPHDVWVIHEDGTLLFESEHPEMVLRNIHQNNQTCSQCHTSFDYIQMILAKRQGAVDYELKNLPKKLAAFAPMEFENARWIVVMNTPYDEITGSLRKGLMETLLLMVIVAFVFVGGSILFYRSERLKIRAEEEARQWREKRALEKKIRQSEERYQTIVETAHDLVLTIDTQGNFTYITHVTHGIKAFPRRLQVTKVW
jgi:PAS domain-containing protein